MRHFTAVRMVSVKKIGNNKCWQGCGEKETVVCCWWGVNWYSHCGKHGSSPEN